CRVARCVSRASARVDVGALGGRKRVVVRSAVAMMRQPPSAHRAIDPLENVPVALGGLQTGDDCAIGSVLDVAGEQTDRLVCITIVICELEQHAINLEAAEPVCL